MTDLFQGTLPLHNPFQPAPEAGGAAATGKSRPARPHFHGREWRSARCRQTNSVHFARSPPLPRHPCACPFTPAAREGLVVYIPPFLPRWDQAHNTKPALPRRGGRAWDQGSGMERRSGDAGGDADQVAGGNEFGFEGGGEGAGWLVEQKPPPERSGASRRQISRSARIRNDLDLPPASTAG